MDNTGHLIVIVAPSGTGKSTLITRLKEKFPQLKESISYTTRNIRSGEENGKHYNFISKEEFERKRDNGDFLEWAVVHSNLYGTDKISVEKSLNSGESLLFDLDVQGADSFREYFKQKANIIFIEPPSVEELEKRLLNRGTESKEVIAERISNARKELTRKEDFDHLVMNKNIDYAYQELEDIFAKILGED